MSRLFARLYLDEDVDVLIGTLLRSRGIDVQTTGEAKQYGKTDAEQFAFAAGAAATLVTHNRSDFEKLAEDYRVSGKYHAGLIIAVRRPPHQIAQRILVLVDQISAGEMDNQVYYL